MLITKIETRFNKKLGFDYEELVSLVIKISSMEVVLRILTRLNLELVHLYVRIVFLHGDLEEEIYTERPAGFKVNGNEGY